MRRVTKMVALAGLAGSAATGCVSVGAPPDSAAGPSASAASTPGVPGVEQPQFVRPSAREMVSDPRPPADGGHRHTVRPSPADASSGSASEHAGHTRPADRAPSPRGLRATPAPVVAPPLPPLPSGTGVCDLGRRYGQWKDGSQAARICAQAYGR